MPTFELDALRVLGLAGRQVCLTEAALDEEYWSTIRGGLFPEIAKSIYGYLHLNQSDLSARLTDAVHFFEQAHEFWQHAKRSTVATAPLLYYYSFLNLAKMAISIEDPEFLRSKPKVQHGLSSNRPSTPIPPEWTITAEHVKVCSSGVFMKLSDLMMSSHPDPGTKLLVQNLLASCSSVQVEVEMVCPSTLPTVYVDRFVIEQRSDGSEHRFGIVVHEPTTGHPQIAPDICQFNQGLRDFAYSTNRFYLKNHLLWSSEEPADQYFTEKVSPFVKRIGMSAWVRHGTIVLRVPLSPDGIALAEPLSVYATMFYFGSIVRYAPGFLSELREKHGEIHWLLDCFLRNAPLAFVRGLLSLTQRRLVIMEAIN